MLVKRVVEQALGEDIGRGDLTTDTIVPAHLRARGKLLAKQPGRLAGLDVVRCCFMMLDPHVDIVAHFEDGDDVCAGDEIMRFSGNARALLSAERVALNILQRMCGIATATSQVVERVKEYDTKVIDTRKTVPGLRMLDKYAVRMGGGVNHRFGLDDGVLIKENHIRVAGGIKAALDRVHATVGHMVKVEIEVTNLEELEEALTCKPDAIMLDNMDLEQMREAVCITSARCLLEASGNITLDNCVDVARTGVDLMSMGWLTHSVKALDLSIQLEMAE